MWRLRETAVLAKIGARVGGGETKKPRILKGNEGRVGGQMEKKDEHIRRGEMEWSLFPLRIYFAINKKRGG